MSPRLTCAQVIDQLTNLDEGALPFPEQLRLRLHLFFCPECRDLDTQLRSLPILVRESSVSQADELLPLAQGSLRSALARISEFRPHRHLQSSALSGDLQRLLASGADLTLQIMASVHQAFLDGSAPLVAPFLPASVMAQLPPASEWEWKVRGGARIATLLDAGGPRLSLLVAPRGFQTPTHIHDGSEQMLVLDGLLEDGTAAYPTGHWVHFGQGTRHAPVVLNDECWCLVREEGTVRFTGPLGWLRNLWAA